MPDAPLKTIVVIVLLIVAVVLVIQSEALELPFDWVFWKDGETGRSAEAVLRDAGQGLDTLAPSQPPRPEPTIRPTPTSTPIPAGW